MLPKQANEKRMHKPFVMVKELSASPANRKVAGMKGQLKGRNTTGKKDKAAAVVRQEVSSRKTPVLETTIIRSKSNICNN